MSWDSTLICLNRTFSYDDIKQKLAAFLGISAEFIEVDRIGDVWHHVDKSTQIVCEITHYDGDFPIRLELVFFNSNHVPPYTLAFIEQLSLVFDAYILTEFGELTPTPNMYVLVRGKDDYQRVVIDPAVADDRVVILKYLED